MVLEKTLESPLDCKGSNQSILKEISPGISLEGTSAPAPAAHKAKKAAPGTAAPRRADKKSAKGPQPEKRSHKKGAASKKDKGSKAKKAAAAGGKKVKKAAKPSVPKVPKGRK